MPLNELVASSLPARDDVQQTDFGYDVVPRYICNNWQEIAAAQGLGAYPFDAVVIGAGMFGGYCAEKLYRLGGRAALRILLLDAGAVLLQSHIQNLPQQLRGKVGGPNYLRMRDGCERCAKRRLGDALDQQPAFSGPRVQHRRTLTVLGRVVASAHPGRPRQLAARRGDLSQ